MATTERVRMTGLAEVTAALRAFPVEFQKRPIRSAIAKGARTIRNAVRAAAPVRSGRMAAAVFASRERDAGAYGLGELYVIGVKPGKKRADTRGAYYWRFVEFGTAKQAAQPFIRPTFAAQAPGVLTQIQADLTAALATTARRVAKG